MSGRTLVDKIWDEHVIAELDGGLDLLHVDRHLVHDVTSPQAFTALTDRSLEVFSPELTFGSPEHSLTILAGRTEKSNTLSQQFVPLMRKNFTSRGLTLFDIDSPEHGIVHVIAPELGLTLPGTTVVCGDSHTCTNGGLGALGFGVGTSEVAHVLATQSLVQRRPATMRIVFTGSLAPHVSPKDLILHTISALGADAGTGCAIEFAGPLIERLGIEERMTICNLAVEIGAKIGIVAPDETAFEYVASRRYAPRGQMLEAAVTHWRRLASDGDAAFDRHALIDVSGIAPQISWGTSPAHTAPVDGRVPDPSHAPDEAAKQQWAQAMDYMGLQPGQPLEGLPIQWCFIGSCTNGRLSDLRAAAAVIDGGRVASHVRALVVPGSAAVRRAAEAEGLDRLFTAAGFEWGEAGCGLCPGLGGVHLAAGERCVSTSNRNFMGRQGAGVRTHLAGPETAAYAAIQGCIADVRRAA
ncbi:MAG TPA: 3-isopropylmalate dehydratase large subunit [Frankiaceae bacterium]|jgi:3-isopropylmalate/(R)-2-methylmalate dehydratase large subunit|nr:3-isopropylmalate dehydratase large subunit [Frankiaceae bacterium]